MGNALHNSVGKSGSNKKSKDAVALITPSKKPRPLSSRGDSSNGKKFSNIHGDAPVNVSFYEVRCGHGPALLTISKLKLI